MGDAPERIWAVGYYFRDSQGVPVLGPLYWREGSWDLRHDGDGDVEYIRADLAAPLAAVAMQESAAGIFDAFDGAPCKPLESWSGSTADAYISGQVDAVRSWQAAIRAIPIPSHADQLAHAMRLPEVVALVREAKSRP